jgi:hypothetical protein
MSFLPLNMYIHLYPTVYTKGGHTTDQNGIRTERESLILYDRILQTIRLLFGTHDLYHLFMEGNQKRIRVQMIMNLFNMEY